jgi:cobalamin synthase
MSAAIIFLLSCFFFTWVFVAMVVTVAILRTYAYRDFGCVTGDMFGAINEINRMISLLVPLATVS